MRRSEQYTSNLQNIEWTESSPSSSSIGTTTLVGFRSAQLLLSILSRKVLQSAVASRTSNPQLGGEPGI
jgi:hypothetical protein